MNKRSYRHTYKNITFEFERVTKKQARAAYKAGLTVVFCPVNLAPFTMWGSESAINPKNCSDKDFDQVLNSYIFYNCINSETGKYPAFYIPVVTGLYGSFAGDQKKTYDYRYIGR